MKAVLVIDMPSECIKCPFQAFECCHPLRKEIPMESITIGEKPNWCPLRPFPEKKRLPDSAYTWEENYWYREGWNECLDEILGEENG